MDKEFGAVLQLSLDMIQHLEGRQYADMGYELLDCGKAGTDVPWVDFLYHCKPEHRNNYGGVFGGMICSVFDTCMGMGSVAVSEHLVTTADLTVSFLRAAMGENFRIHLEYTHVGGRLINIMGKMFDHDSGELVATATSTFAVLQNAPKDLRD